MTEKWKYKVPKPWDSINQTQEKTKCLHQRRGKISDEVTLCFEESEEGQTKPDGGGRKEITHIRAETNSIEAAEQHKRSY